jgi:ParB family chromosome partitioning protein
VALGFREIPAIVVEVSREDRLLRSLVENIARRHPSPMELICEIERLRELGYTIHEVAAKLDIGDQTVIGLTALKQAGEQRLLEAAINGRVPLWVAIDIAKATTPETQRALLNAFEEKHLTRASIGVIKRLINQRRFLGNEPKPDERSRERYRPTAEQLVIAFKRESRRQKEVIRKAKIAEQRLVFIAAAFNKLLADERFLTLLRAESLTSMPESLWSKLDLKPKEAS